MDASETRRFSFWALLGFLGCALIAAAFFLPWLSISQKHRAELGLQANDVAVHALAEAGKRTRFSGARSKAGSRDERTRFGSRCDGRGQPCEPWRGLPTRGAARQTPAEHPASRTPAGRTRERLPNDLRDLEDAAREQGREAKEILALLKRMRAGEAPTGRELVTLFGWSLHDAKTLARITPRELRVFRSAYWVLALLPWVAGALGLLLLLDRLRRLGSFSIADLFVFGTVLGSLAGLMWLGASVQARKHAADTAVHMGLGLKAMAVGGLACFLAAAFGVRAGTRWRGWGLGLLLSVALVGGIAFYVHG